MMEKVILKKVRNKYTGVYPHTSYQWHKTKQLFTVALSEHPQDCIGCDLDGHEMCQYLMCVMSGKHYIFKEVIIEPKTFLERFLKDNRIFTEFLSYVGSIENAIANESDPMWWIASNVEPCQTTKKGMPWSTLNSIYIKQYKLYYGL